MKKLMTIAACCLVAASCSQQPEQTSGLHLENMDTTAQPGTDFYQFATGGWQKLNPLPAEYSRFGSFDQLAETNQKRINELVETLASQENPAGSVAQKVGDLYKMAMDSVKRNADGYEPVKADLAEVAAIKNVHDVYALLPKMAQNGSGAYFGIYVGADEKNSMENAVQMSQGGLTMGLRDYYLEDDEAIVKIREAFKEHVVKMFKLYGYSDADAQKGRDVVMEVETRLAKAFRSNVELRDPEANYNKMSMEQLKNDYPSFEWDTYLNGMGLKDVKEIIVGQPNSLKESADVIATLPIDKQRIYLQWKLIDDAASSLSDEIEAQNFDFYSRTMRGVQEQQPRWKRAVNVVSGVLGEAVGQMYVEKYFSAEAKTRMTELVGNLQKALGERIQNLDWMSDATKAKALDKLSTFTVKIGYPDKWKDYSTLDIKNDSYYENMKRASQWAYADMVSRYGKPVDRTEWFMTPQTVNAYYNPTTNEICFPAGILQYPFFDMNADDAFNYGAIGVVIGHEMTHGFDDQGRQYDKDGNLKDWWAEEDAQKFKDRAQVIIDFYDSIEVAPGLHGNGSLTQGENIADHGGLKIAYQAFKNATKNNPLPVKDGFTPEQRFYIAYATVWGQNITEAEIRNRTKSDPHALGKWRVNGTMPQLDTWYEAFGITEKDPMYIAPEKRVNVW
ncbi:MAG: M13 family metallopeptidase [Bacteroidaceae bacterium]|nr:M13 family metallopeptidase [Bacteroidaceae bacterium]MBQ8008936.1 M13 family metallopeptidase [Bacteroidaceae bacterium]MBR1541761.1 M13 family metallopeptidase [Bacteroidaceae bacterium]